MTRNAVDERDAGSIHIVVCVVVVIAVFFIFAMLHSGRTQLTQQELQIAADNHALVAAALLRETALAAGELDTNAIDAAMSQHQTGIPYKAKVRLIRGRGSEVLVKVTAVADDESPFDLSKRSKKQIAATAYARIYEHASGTERPPVVVMLDASYSMTDTVEGGKTLFQLMTNIMERFARGAFPVRIGVVAFNDKIVAAVKPKSNNKAAISRALRGVRPDGTTNIAKGLKRAGELLKPFRRVRRDVILITDGKPTAGAHFKWPSWKSWSFFVSSKKAAKQAADKVRKLPAQGAAVFAIETRPESMLPDWAKKAAEWVKKGVHKLPVWIRGRTIAEYLTYIAGGPMSEGNDPTYVTQVKDPSKTESLLAAMARRVCSFGPVKWHGRADKLAGERVFAFIRDRDGDETALDLLQNAAASYDREGYEIYPAKDQKIHVLLTMKSCFNLGSDRSRQVVIRWGHPELVQAPGRAPGGSTDPDPDPRPDPR